MVQPRDAREASDVFYRQKLGDVLLTYENEVVLTNQVGMVNLSFFDHLRHMNIWFILHSLKSLNSNHTYSYLACRQWDQYKQCCCYCWCHWQVYGAEKSLPYVVPSPNVRIECPLALVDKVLDNRPAAARQAARGFGQFLFSSEAQVRRCWR